MRKVFVVCIGLVLASGCRKQSAPEFYALESQATVLIDRDGDEAYSSPLMEPVVAGLERIPPGAIEGPKAAALLARITSERNRLAAEAAARARPSKPTKVAPPSPWPPPTVSPPVAAATAEPVDAGPPPEPVPTAGMPEADFMKAFGACFKSGPPLTFQGGKTATSALVTASPACLKRFATGEGEVAYVFVEGKFVGTRNTVRSTTMTYPPDAPAPKPAAVDAGEPPPVRRVFPGQPLE